MTGCPIAHLATLLDMESSGGRNVWGKPPGECGQTRFSEVTEQSWHAYLARRNTCGQQGAGPLQLTWPGIQDAADAAGGCWRPHINVQVGARHFAELLKSYGNDRDALSAWNTGKPGWTTYSRLALPRLAEWQRILAG